MNHAAIQALDATLRSLAVDERKALVRFLRHLEVLDRAQAYAALNCGSTFEYWCASATCRRAPHGPG